MHPDHEYQGIRAKSEAISARDTVRRQLLNVPGADGWIEVAAFDCLAVFQCDTAVDGVTHREQVQLGPAGSKHLFRVRGNATVTYTIPHCFGTAEHADPYSGVYSTGAGTRDAKVQAIYFDEKPETRETRVIGYATDADEDPIPAATTTAGAFPPGYCRHFAWLQLESELTTKVWGLLTQTQGAGGGKVGDYVYEETTSVPSGGGRVHPWMRVEIENTAAAATASGALIFSSDEDA